MRDVTSDTEIFAVFSSRFSFALLHCQSKCHAPAIVFQCQPRKDHCTTCSNGLGKDFLAEEGAEESHIMPSVVWGPHICESDCRLLARRSKNERAGLRRCRSGHAGVTHTHTTHKETTVGEWVSG